MRGDGHQECEAAAPRVQAYVDWVQSLGAESPLPPPDGYPCSRLSSLKDEIASLHRGFAQREREMAGLLDVMRSALRRDLLDDVLNDVFDGLHGIVPFERIGCALLSDDGGALTAYWSKSCLPGPSISPGYTQALQDGSLANVLANRQPRVINDLVAYAAQNPRSATAPLMVAEGARSSLTWPLVAGERALGLLFFTSPQAGAYDHHECHVFPHIVAQVSALLLQCRINADLAGRNRLLLDRTRELESLALADPLTGALNRRGIERLLQATVQASADWGVIVADIDHFKHVNDRFGHDFGDALLQSFVSRAQQMIRGGDRIGRLGGEEFLIVITNHARLALRQVAERVRRAVAALPMDLHGQSVAVTVSLGTALATHGEAPFDVVRRADQAMYEAKRGGRDRVVEAA